LFVSTKTDKSWKSVARAFDSWLEPRDNWLWQGSVLGHSEGVGQGVFFFAFFKVAASVTELSEF